MNAPSKTLLEIGVGNGVGPQRDESVAFGVGVVQQRRIPLVTIPRGVSAFSLTCFNINHAKCLLDGRLMAIKVLKVEVCHG